MRPSKRLHSARISFLLTPGTWTISIKVSAMIKKTGRRNKIEIAFGGNIRLEEIEKLKSIDVDILDCREGQLLTRLFWILSTESMGATEAGVF